MNCKMKGCYEVVYFADRQIKLVISSPKFSSGQGCVFVFPDHRYKRLSQRSVMVVAELGIKCTYNKYGGTIRIKPNRSAVFGVYRIIKEYIYEGELEKI